MSWLHILKSAPRGFRCVIISLALALPSIFWAPNSAQAQDDTCTYDTCALRLKHRFFAGPRIVQGRAEKHVASAGIFPPRVPLFAARSDTAAVLYSKFRAGRTQSSLLGLTGGLAVLIGGIALSDDNGDDGLAITAVAVGLGLEIGSVVLRIRSNNRLSSAIWWYNQTLDRL